MTTRTASYATIAWILCAISAFILATINLFLHTTGFDLSALAVLLGIVAAGVYISQLVDKHNDRIDRAYKLGLDIGRRDAEEAAVLGLRAVR